MENLAADHISRLDNPDLEILNEKEINNKLYDEYLLVTEELPWYADIVNYLAASILYKGMNYNQWKKLFADHKYHI